MQPEINQPPVRCGSDLRLIVGANLFVLALIGMCQAAYAVIY